MTFKENISIDYIELINAIGSVVPICEYADDKITLRHDVDHDLSHALRLAELEYKNGIRSTYYILPPEYNKVNYYGRWVDNKLEMFPLTKARTVMLQDMGHEVGLHSNLVTLCKQSGQSAEQIMSYIVKDFKDNDIMLRSTASHGDSGARNGKYINYQVWEEMWQKDFEFEQIRLSDYGLVEAYNLRRINYLSDSGGKFALCNETNISKNITDKNDIFNFVNELKKPSQILIHPIWWS